LLVTLALLAYNEAETIEGTVRQAADEMRRAWGENDWEILVVNDGSRDATGALCDTLSAQIPNVRVLHHDPNRGYIEATLSALRAARGTYICIFDGDGQHTAEDVPRFIEKLKGGCDIVFGWKRQRYDHITRLVLTRGLRLAARYFLRTRLHDINAGCRGYRKERAPELMTIRHRINFVGPELYTRARLHDMKICEMVVRHKPREGGESSHPLQKIPREIWEVFCYLRALRGELRAAGKFRRWI
jgi:glycosyltransferase involved in cell wall biosynthesis